MLNDPIPEILTLSDRSSPNRLIAHWKSQGMVIAPGVSDEDILEFENREKVRVPQEFRSYLQQVNGMPQTASSDCDNNMFAFWQLDRIKRVRDECPEYATEPRERSFFVFADYMIWSWAYAIEMGTDISKTGQVILVGGLRPQVVAQSFAEFIDLYIRDARELYAHP